MVLSLRRYLTLHYCLDRLDDGEGFTTEDIQNHLEEFGSGYSGAYSSGIYAFLKSAGLKDELRVKHGCKIIRIGNAEGTGRRGKGNIVMKVVACVTANASEEEVAEWL